MYVHPLDLCHMPKNGRLCCTHTTNQLTVCWACRPYTRRQRCAHTYNHDIFSLSVTLCNRVTSLPSCFDWWLLIIMCNKSLCHSVCYCVCACVCVGVCSSLKYGVFTTEDDEYFVEPLQWNSSVSATSGQLHLVYKRSDIQTSTAEHPETWCNETSNTNTEGLQLA